tara:strand:- start:5203 stop:6090 length:888 start_codon:yes stop_codon:yes gene_type:complete
MSFWTDNRITPKRKSLFYVKISSQFFLPFVKTCSKPSANIETKEFKLINHFIKYPGLVKWNPISITMVDMNGGYNLTADTGNILFRILTHSGYYFPNVDRHSYSLTGKDSTGKNNILTELTTPEKEKMAFGSLGPGLTGNYDKANSGIEIFQVDSYGYVREHWVLKNPIVKSLKWGDLAYDSDEPVEYTLEIDYDWAELKEDSKSMQPTIGKEYQNFMKTLKTTDEVVADVESIAKRRAASADEYGSGFGMGQGFDAQLQEEEIAEVEFFSDSQEQCNDENGNVVPCSELNFDDE